MVKKANYVLEAHLYYNQFSTVSLAGHSAEQHSRFCFFYPKDTSSRRV